MQASPKWPTVFCTVLSGVFLLAVSSFAQHPPVRIRGVIEAIDGPNLTIKIMHWRDAENSARR
jgi:hypothetical protein